MLAPGGNGEIHNLIGSVEERRKTSWGPLGGAHLSHPDAGPWGSGLKNPHARKSWGRAASFDAGPWGNGEIHNLIGSVEEWRKATAGKPKSGLLWGGAQGLIPPAHRQPSVNQWAGYPGLLYRGGATSTRGQCPGHWLESIRCLRPPMSLSSVPRGSQGLGSWSIDSLNVNAASLQHVNSGVVRQSVIAI